MCSTPNMEHIAWLAFMFLLLRTSTGMCLYKYSIANSWPYTSTHKGLVVIGIRDSIGRPTGTPTRVLILKVKGNLGLSCTLLHNTALYIFVPILPTKLFCMLVELVNGNCNPLPWGIWTG